MNLLITLTSALAFLVALLIVARAIEWWERRPQAREERIRRGHSRTSRP